MSGRRVLTLAAVALFWAAPAALAQPGSIAGVVVKWPSGEPAAGAVVKLTDEAPAEAPPGFQLQSTTTAVDGSFRFDNLEPHDYYVVANAQGYLPAEYGQRSPTGTGIAFAVRRGQRVTLRLTAWPTSGIAGRVVDGDGDPIGRAQVLALRLVYGDGGPSMTIAQTVMTNDRGEYRMFWLTPGTYRVAAREWSPLTSAPAVSIGPPRRFSTAEQATPPNVHRRTLPNGTVVEETDVPIYAPSTRELSLASSIVLAPGDSAANVDIQLAGNLVPAYHVRGVVIRSGTDPRPAQLQLVPRVRAPFAAIASTAAAANGTFDIAGVPAGSYFLYRSDGQAAQPIEVADADVDVTVAESPLVKLTGRITFDRGLSADVAVPKASDVQIQMSRDPDLLGAPDGGPRFNPPPGDDGALNLNTIPPGDYRIAVWPLSDRDSIGLLGRRPPDSYADAYLKSIHLGDVDVLADGLHLWSPSQPALDIVIGLNGGHVEGTVVENGRAPVPNVTVVAVPDGGNKARRDLVRHGTTDGRGHFAFDGVAPGDYSFYAFDGVERGAWMNADFLRAFEGRGRFVRVREGKNDLLDLTVLVGR